MLSFSLLVRLGALVSSHVAHNFAINLVNIGLGLSQFFLQALLFLSKSILGAFGVLVDQVFDLVRYFTLVHRCNDIFSICVKLRWEDLRHCL